MSVEEDLKYIIKITSKFLYSCADTQTPEESQTYKTGLHIRGTKRVQKGTEVLPLLKKGSAGELVQKTTGKLSEFHTNCE